MPGRVEVKRRGEVTVLRFRRQEYRPERKPSAKRFLLKLRTLVPCTAETITGDALEDLILKTFGSDYQYHILISDEWFRVITKEQMEQLLKEDDTDALPYVDTVADCDDFSDVLLGQLTRKTWQQGFALGQLWWFCSQFGHAQNLACTGDELLIVEPQNDEITTWSDVKSKYPDAKAFMVKF